MKTAYERMSNNTCPSFRWIGQPFTSCDECGYPYWEHSHEATFDKPFGGEKRVVISTETAMNIQRRWG